jgi:AAA15 family ATPase/GTPase
LALKAVIFLGGRVGCAKFETMEKIIIKGFGPIKDAEIEVKKLLVLIGEQASGKSTIAKLIYFFKSLPDEFFEEHFGLYSEESNIQASLHSLAVRKFYDYFGSTWQIGDFEITFQFDDQKSITLSKAIDGKLEARSIGIFVHNAAVADGLFSIVQLELRQIRDKLETERGQNARTILQNEEERLVRKMSQLINTEFGSHHNSKLFIIAGREGLVSYQSVFESFLGSELMRRFKGNGTNGSSLDGNTADINLMLGFLREVQEMRRVFHKYENFDIDIEEITTSISLEKFQMLKSRMEQILKGKYRTDGTDERLIHENGYVFLRDASSGQKEAIRILQDILLSAIQSRNVLRVIEEPEAHLFPIAQKHLIELLVFLANAKPENQVIITTHSPYVLTTLNNLLLATRVVAKNPSAEDEVAEVAPKAFRIDPTTFAAYSLGNSFDENEPYCANIVDPETAMIAQNYLDTVSDLLGMEFDHLRNIHLRSFQRHGG